MTEKQLIKWFIDLYNSCYPFVHSDFPESIFMIYDKRFIRKIKLCQISNIAFKIPDVNICQGQFLFEIDCKNKIFYYDYDNDNDYSDDIHRSFVQKISQCNHHNEDDKRK